MTNKRLILSILASVAVFFLPVSCRQNGDKLMERQELFSLGIGRMEDQLFVQQVDGVNTLSKTRLYMKDGFFLISNGESDKIMEFSSYGDLTSLYYNGRTNPSPVILGNGKDDNISVTRTAYEYPFNDPGEIALTGNSELLVDDRIDENRREYDESINAMLDRIVLRFDSDGSLVSYIGQEGPGGTPFPYIHDISVTSSDEICVITRNPEGWRVFWYTRMGDLLYRIDFLNDRIPIPEAELVPAVENILADRDQRRLYLKMDYYEKNPLKNSINFSRSCIYWYDIDQQQYGGNIDLPRNYVKTEEPVIFEERTHEYLYELAGVASGPAFFLLGPYMNGLYRLTVIDMEGKVSGRVLVDFSDEDIFFRDYYVSPDGILSALVCNESAAHVSWWRSDGFMEERGDKGRRFFPDVGN